MAQMVLSALVQEIVSRGISYVLGKRKENASHGHLADRLEAAVKVLEYALERAQELQIRHLSLISRLKQIKCAYVEAMELLDKHKQQQAKKRKLWVLTTSSFAGLSTDDVQRFVSCAVDDAGMFLRDVESGCSLHHYTICNPIVRRLLEGKTLWYNFKQGNLARNLCILPMYSDERGVEAALLYSYEDNTMVEKCFTLWFFLRLSENIDIVGLVIEVLQILKAAFKHPVESAMAELTLVPNLQLQDIARTKWLSTARTKWLSTEKFIIEHIRSVRPNPACCEERRHGICAKDNVSSGLADIFPEQVIRWSFHCYYVPAPESNTPMAVNIHFSPHYKSPYNLYSMKYVDDFLNDLLNALLKGPIEKAVDVFTGWLFKEGPYRYAVETIGHDVEKRINDVTIQEVVETVESNAISCFSRQPEQRDYRIEWFCSHGKALFSVKNRSVETTAGVPRTRKRYNTRSNKDKGESSRRQLGS